MSLEIKSLPGSEVEIFIEVPAEEFEKIYQEAREKALKNISLNGFRPGKVPKELAEKNLDEGNVLKKTAEEAIRKFYFPVLIEKKIEAIGKPLITITKIAKGNSFCFKAKTAVLPEITLPDYRKIVAEIRNKVNDANGQSVGEEMKKRQKIQLDILEAISAASEMEIPEVLVVAEKEKMLGEFKASIENMGMSWPDYLAHLQKSEDDLRKDWQEDALRRVKYGLILREFAEKENIEVNAEEVQSRVEEIIKQNPELDREYLQSYTYGIIRNEKVFEFLENI